MRWAWLLIFLCGCAWTSAVEAEAEFVVLPAKMESRAPKQVETYSSLSVNPKNSPDESKKSALLNYEYRSPAALSEVGQTKGFRVEISADFRLKIYASYALSSGKRSDWAPVFDQPADRDAVNELIAWMEKKKLDCFDARAVGEKCAESGKSAYAPTAPNELLSVKFSSAPDSALIYWRDLPRESKIFSSVAEVQALNAAFNEIVAFAINACPEKSVLRTILKRE